MTLSISAHCLESDQLGVAISSSSMAVGSRCPWLLPDVDAVTSQNVALPSLGPHIFSTLEVEASVEQALNLALTENRFCEYRQIATIDANGEVAAFSREHTPGIGGTLAGDNCVAANNMLASCETIAAMVAAFETASGELANRLLAGSCAGIAIGGETGPVHSTAVKVVGDYPWPAVDLYIDRAGTSPLAALEQL